MRKMNDFGFVFSLLERSDIVVASDDGDDAAILLDADTLEAIGAQLLAERMLGVVQPLAADAVAMTIH